ncbi:LytR/AlgR family response regulator transcription factor [Flectobacillus major]|uniref:LytR/AlgR family response regulator transcription factor n=1 Tax=Flectobacillus major TaxID=103 RepID=UPI0003F5C4DE|nr:LytTR family DNA-binding domain-containing protein [Flectobacillus major]
MAYPLKCIVIDDELPAQQVMQHFIEKIPFLQLDIVLSNALEGLEYIRQHEVDIVFTDIKMPEISGIQMLKSLHKRPYVIITSAYQEYAIEGFDLDVGDFLVKPIAFDRFLKAINKITLLHNSASSIPTILEESQGEEDTKFYVKENGKITRIDFDNILYIEGLGDYIKIVPFVGKTIVTHITMKKVESLLPSQLFFRIHKSYIVQIDAVKSIEGNVIELENDTKLQIGLQFRERVLQRIKPIN